MPDSIEQLREWIITERGDSAKDEFNRRYKEADEELRLAPHFNHTVTNRKGKLAEDLTLKEGALDVRKLFKFFLIYEKKIDGAIALDLDFDRCIFRKVLEPHHLVLTRGDVDGQRGRRDFGMRRWCQGDHRYKSYKKQK